MYQAIKILYPTASNADFSLQDDSDGKGPYIKSWDAAKLGPQPTQAQIDAAIPLAESAFIKKRTNDPIYASIIQLELAQQRAVRENALNHPGANTRLADIEARIVELRASLV